MNFCEAGNYYLCSKKLSSEVIKYASQAGGEITDALIEEYTGVSGQAVKLAAGAAGLAILTTMNTYICQDKVKSHNPEVISSVQQELSNKIQDMEVSQIKERFKMTQSSTESSVKELRNFSDRNHKLTSKQNKSRTL